MINTCRVRMLCASTIFAVSLSLGSAPFAQAVENAKSPTHVGKSKRKAVAEQAKQEPASATACVYHDKSWGDGKHCMTTCNAQGTLCDMQICNKGNWKPYSSCFGPSAVAPNCPPSCG